MAETLTTFRDKALRADFSIDELAGANICVSLPAAEVILAQPLILPGNACMLALGATQVLPHLDRDGALIAHQSVHLGLSYDHRLINGRDAALFLGEVKRAFESPHRLDSLVVPASDEGAVTRWKPSSRNHGCWTVPGRHRSPTPIWS